MTPALTLTQRVANYQQAFPQYPDSWPWVSHTGRWLNGMWLLGNNYRGSGMYGAYPPAYLKRITALFPDVDPDTWLHLFSGSLEPTIPGWRVDLRDPVDGVVPPHVRGDAHRLPLRSETFPLCAADPPYTPADAARYGTGVLRKRDVLIEVGRVLRVGGFLIWLDTTLPMYQGKMWHHWGMIGIQRSCNHRMRLCSLFTRI